MADRKQVVILNKGVEEWNRWRNRNPNAVVDLSNYRHEDPVSPKGPKQSPLSLNKVNFSSGNLTGADFSFTDLEGANFVEAQVRNANFSYAKLATSNWQEAFGERTRFVSADMEESDINRVIFEDCDFKLSRLTSLNASLANLDGSDFSGALLDRANLHKANLLRATFVKSNLLWADISEATFGSTFISCDLSTAYGIDQAEHISPSMFDMHCLGTSKGSLPIAFLRGVGLSDWEIEVAKLFRSDLDNKQIVDVTYEIARILLNSPLSYYSCFISYSHVDTVLARKLHDDLQNAGVRCWLDEEDLKTGDPLRPTVDREIRQRDKLLVILSKNSISSEWVGDEVESAIAEEGRASRLILFPIMIDDAPLNAKQDWPAKIKNRRRIGDFRGWNDPETYGHAFARLLRDLKSVPT